MHSKILKQMRDKVQSRQYVMTLHAEEEMNDDNLSIFDVESGVLTGRILERQKDRDTAECKYVIEGKTLAGRGIAIVAKISVTQKLVIITVWGE